MPRETLENALKTLKEALAGSRGVDPDDAELLRSLDEDIHRLLADDHPNPDEPHGLIERAESLAASFRADHPHLEKIFREIIDTLARIGV